MMQDYEKDYETFWRDLVEHEDGTLNLDAVKRELSDYHHVMRQANEVYYHITGGRLSKPNWDSATVIQVAEEYAQQDQAVFTNDILDEIIETARRDELDLEQVLTLIEQSKIEVD